MVIEFRQAAQNQIAFMILALEKAEIWDSFPLDVKLEDLEALAARHWSAEFAIGWVKIRTRDNFYLAVRPYVILSQNVSIGFSTRYLIKLNKMFTSSMLADLRRSLLLKQPQYLDLLRNPHLVCHLLHTLLLHGLLAGISMNLCTCRQIIHFYILKILCRWRGGRNGMVQDMEQALLLVVAVLSSWELVGFEDLLRWQQRWKRSACLVELDRR